MLGRRLVYSSKDRQDWEKAKGILDEGRISFHAWVSEEAPVGGCGSKIDIRAIFELSCIAALTSVDHVHTFDIRRACK